MADPAADPSADPGEREAAGEPRGVPWKAVLFAWLVPGAGHVYLGRWARGAAYALIVLSLVVGGCLLEGKLWRLDPSLVVSGGTVVAALLTALSLGLGLPYGALVVAGYQGEVTAQGYEYGTCFLLTAALMNLLLVLDARDVSLGRKP